MIFVCLFLLCFVLPIQAEEVKVFVLTYPVSNQRVLPNEPVFVPTTSEILIIATPGEYEPGSFVLNSKENLQQVEIEVSDLKSKEGEIIKSSSVDIKIVKCWYQDKGRGYIEKTPARGYSPIGYSGKKVLVPELLLNDDNLIKVDYEKGKNYIKIKTEKEEKYIDITPGNDVEEIEKQLPDGYNKWSGMTLVKDSEKLLPFELKENENKQVWLTIKIPEDQKAGIYEGNVGIKNKGKELVNIVMKINVLPFKLCSYYPISSIYCQGMSRDLKNFKKENEDLYTHGILEPYFHDTYVDKNFEEIKDDFGQRLKILQEIGLYKRGFYFFCGRTRHFIEPTSDNLNKLKENVKKIVDFGRSYGINDVYFYGIDEAREERLTAQRPVWEAIHEAGGKVFVAGYKGDNFSLMGDIQDLLVCAGYPSREEAEKWHAKGHKIVCYGNPQGGIEAPDTYRRNFGILLWQYNYDGAMTYCYHWEIQGFGPMWSDWCERKYKAHNMVYPTGDGVIDTLQWEGYREGIDDVRYLNVLIEEVKKAKDSQMVKKEAQKFLEELKKGDINRDIEDMDTLRLKIIDYIMKLKGKQ